MKPQAINLYAYKSKQKEKKVTNLVYDNADLGKQIF
jgi:hypothetical protein